MFVNFLIFASEAGEQVYRFVFYPVVTSISREDYQQAAELLTGDLEYVLSKRFQIVSREDLKKVLEEKKLSLMGLTDEDIIDASSLIPGARYALFVKLLSIVYKRVELKATKVLKEKGKVLTGKSVTKSEKVSGYEAKVRVLVKVYDLKKNKVIFRKQIEGKWQAVEKDEALENAVDDAADSILYALRKKFPLEVEVVSVISNDTVSVSASKGVSLSERLLFYNDKGMLEVVEAGSPARALVWCGNFTKGDRLKEYVWMGFAFSVAPMLLNHQAEWVGKNVYKSVPGAMVSAFFYPKYSLGLFGEKFMENLVDRSTIQGRIMGFVLDRFLTRFSVNAYITPEVIPEEYWCCTVRRIMGDVSFDLGVFGFGGGFLLPSLGLALDSLSIEFDDGDEYSYNLYGLSFGAEFGANFSPSWVLRAFIKYVYSLSEPEFLNAGEDGKIGTIDDMYLGTDKLLYGLGVEYRY